MTACHRRARARGRADAGQHGRRDAAPPGKAIEGRTPLQLAWARLRKDRVSLVSLGSIVLLVLIAIFATL